MQRSLLSPMQLVTTTTTLISWASVSMKSISLSSRKTVEIAVAMGIIQFNKGAQVLLNATAAVVPQASSNCQLSELADRMDKSRLPQPN